LRGQDLNLRPSGYEPDIFGFQSNDFPKRHRDNLHLYPFRILKVPKLPFNPKLLLDHQFFSEFHMFQHNVPRHLTIAGS
jgi:hypothetical protein